MRISPILSGLRRAASVAILSLVIVVSLSACAAREDAAASSEAIVGGMPGGNTAVVWIYNRSGGLCSGTLITPSVVLTAKHCVQNPGATAPSAPSSFVVGFGSRVFSGTTARVRAVYTTPGVWEEGGFTGLSGAIVGVDVAVMVLAAPVTAVTPIPIDRRPASELVGMPFTATGFGQIPGGSSGTRYTVDSIVRRVTGTLIYVDPVICQGDSGGPMIVEDRVVGVVSFGRGGEACGSSIDGAYNNIDGFLDMIDMAIRESGECPMTDEICDGFDNDCNGEVDEVCTRTGQPCEADGECEGGTTCMESTGGTRICTRACDPQQPLECGDGLYCMRTTACDGVCATLEAAHDLPEGSPCESHDECESLFCADPGDGAQRCLRLCEGDTGSCRAGEVCAAFPGQCGGCLPEGYVSGQRGLGEACTADADCRSGACLEDGPRSYCTRACTGSDSECGTGFHCRVDVCAAGVRGSIGDYCADNADCAPGTFCAMRGDEHWCSALCSDSMPCPMHFDCVSAGGGMVCAPQGGLTGDACDDAADCISGRCSDEGRGLVCVEACDASTPCAPGFECRAAVDGEGALCVAPVRAAASGGGCAVSAPGRANRGADGRGASALLAALAMLGVVVWRRRARS